MRDNKIPAGIESWKSRHKEFTEENFTNMFY